MFGLMRKESFPTLLRPEIEPLALFKDGIDEWFERLMARTFAPRLGEFWKSEVEETEKEFVVRMELPGFELNAIEVRLVENMLVVEARTPEEAEKKEERPVRHFRRSMTLPAGLDLAKLEAVYRNGILEIRVPRMAEVAGRRIEVRK